jgi:hypothetical protein
VTTFIAMLPFLGKVLDLVMSLLGEFFKAKAAAAAAQKAFDVDQAAFKVMVTAVLQRNQAAAPGQSGGAGTGWDAADGNRNGQIPPPRP